MQGFNERVFKGQLSDALEKVKVILENARKPRPASEVSHSYADKFRLAEFLTKMAVAAQFNVLKCLGLNEEGVKMLRSWSKSESIILRFSAKERCCFEKNVIRKTEQDTSDGRFWGLEKWITTTIVNHIQEYHWRYRVHYKLVAYKAKESASSAESLMLSNRKTSCTIVTTTDTTPKPDLNFVSPIETNISWLLNVLDENLEINFSINRDNTTCRTPRRNADIESCVKHFEQLYDWSNHVYDYFMNQVFCLEPDCKLDTSVFVSDLFIPVLPLFEETVKNNPETKTHSDAKFSELVSISPTSLDLNSPLVPFEFIPYFLNEQRRTLSEKIKTLSEMFQNTNKILTCCEAYLITLALHSRNICSQYIHSLDYIENMLYKQLSSAIGKEVSVADFSRYMYFHSKKLLKTPFQPVPFCYPIRRQNHYPEGIVTIEDAEQQNEPIFTSVRKVEPVQTMTFALNAATNISFTGERLLHTWLDYEFDKQSKKNMNLVVRAHQFSSFILLVGRIASATTFEPKHAIIIQNKDELQIPLLLDQIPSPKEFKDAIESLSPEQQAFCKAFRALQLQNTLFAILIVQIKPQLERVLKLPPYSLTKEIELSDKLLELFIKYQIPSDLLAFNGPQTAPTTSKLALVKYYVNRMQQIIKQSGKEQLEERKEAARYDSTRLPDISEVEEIKKILQSNIEKVISRGEKLEALPEHSLSNTRPFLRKSPGLWSSLSSQLTQAITAGASQIQSLTSTSDNWSNKEIQSPPLQSPQQDLSRATVGESPTLSNTQTQPQQNEKRFENEVHESIQEEKDEQEFVDFTKLPAELESKFGLFDKDNALHPTIINTGDSWNKTQQSLLGNETNITLNKEEQHDEKNAAFDLLDALSQSGSLTIQDASLHVVVAVTHCFDKSLIHTIIQNNLNPIEKIETSSLLINSTLHARPISDLIKEPHTCRTHELCAVAH